MIVRFFVYLLTVGGVLWILGCAHHQPRTSDDMIEYGVHLAENGYWHEAAVRWRMVLETEPENVAALNNLAIAAEFENHPEEALHALQKALQLRPDSKIIKKNIESLQKRAVDVSTRAEEKDRKKREK